MIRDSFVGILVYFSPRNIIYIYIDTGILSEDNENDNNRLTRIGRAVMSVNGCRSAALHQLKRNIIMRYRVNSGLLAFTGHTLEDRVL